MKRISIFLLAALALAGCRTPSTRFSERALDTGFAATNRAGVVISGGQQMNTLLGGDGAFSDWKSVAETAAASGNEFSLTVIGHGASRQPDVKRESTSAKKAQDAFGNMMAKAASGDQAGAGEAIGEVLFYGAAYAAEQSNPPQADEAGFVGAYAAVGPGANLSGLGVAAELRQTRVESIRAARANYSSSVTYAPQDITTTNGTAMVNAALPYLADAYKAKLAADAAKNSPAAVVGGSPKPGDKPEAETPAAVPPGDSGAGEPSTARAYVAKNYPGLRLGGGNEKGGNDRAPIESNLWKPVRENGGNLCVIIAHSKHGVVKRVMVDDEVLSFDAIGNGWRLHTNADKSGGAYSGKIQVVTSTGTWTGKIADVNKKAGFDLVKAASSADLQPGAGTPPGE